MASNPQRIQELQRELAGNPSSRQFYQLGELLRREGRAAEAVPVLRGGLGFHPRYVAAWVALGRCYLEIGQAAGAAGALDSAIALDQANPVAWRLLGEARLMLGSRLGALEAMARALELAPGDDVLQAAVESLSSQTAPPESVPTAPPEPPPSEPLTVEPAPAAPETERAQASAPHSDMIWPYFQPAPAPPRWQSVAAPPPREIEELPDPFATTGVFSAAELGGLDVFEVEPAPALLVGEGPFGAVEAAGPELAEPLLHDEAEVAPERGAATLAESEPVPAIEIPMATEVARPEADAPALELVDEPPAFAAEGEPTAEEASTAEATAAPLFTVGEPESLPVESIEAVAPPTAVEAPVAPPPVAFPPPASITLARLHIQQQQFDDAVAMLERLLRADPENQEAHDLLELVRDMMEPMPEPLPPL
ncbi:MAG: tetratricopeptide repeat protein, partial [Acidobacteriota bacterium]